MLLLEQNRNRFFRHVLYCLIELSDIEAIIISLAAGGTFRLKSDVQIISRQPG